MLFEWDESKRLSNLAKHSLDFAGGAPLFAPGGWLLTAPDQRKNYGEDRFMGFGCLTGRVVAVCFTVRGPVVRIISLRKPTNVKRKPTREPSKTSGSVKTKAKARKAIDLEDGEVPDMGQNMAFWASVKPFKAPVPKAQLTIRLDQDVVDWFRGLGRGYQTQINLAL